MTYIASSGLHDRTLSKRGGRRERQRLPKNVKNKSHGGKNIFCPPTQRCGLQRGILSNYQTDHRFLPGSNTDLNLRLFLEKHKNYWSKLGGIHFKENWRNCFIFIYLFQQINQLQPQWMQAAWQAQVKGHCSLAFPYIKLSLL